MSRKDNIFANLIDNMLDKINLPNMKYDDYWDDYDWCYECAGYGDDYYHDEDGNLISNCEGCIHDKG